jgi:hypothetical protein
MQNYLGLTDQQWEELKRFPERILAKAYKNCQWTERKSYSVWAADRRRKYFRACIKAYLSPSK